MPIVKHYDTAHGCHMQTTWDPWPSTMIKHLEAILEEYITYNNITAEERYKLMVNMTLGFVRRFEDRATPILKDLFIQPLHIGDGLVMSRLHEQMMKTLLECARRYNVWSPHIRCVKVDIWRPSAQSHIKLESRDWQLISSPA